MFEQRHLCEKCGQYFFSNHAKSKYCAFSCEESAKIEKSNSKWLNKKPRAKPDNGRIERARVGKNSSYGLMKKFNSCRG